MSKKKRNRLMAYIYMPLIFATIGYLLIYLILSPIIPQMSIINLVMSENKPGEPSEVTSIFEGPGRIVVKEDPAKVDAAGKKATYVDEKDIVIPKYGSHYAVVEIKNVSLKVNLYWGDNDAVLKKGVGQYIGSSIPGYEKPLLICGHNNGEFNKLKGVGAGDIITITTNYGVYEYRISDTKIAKSDDKSAYDLAQDKEQCILYTCYPFNMLGLTDKRFFVYADKISGPEIR